MKTRIGAVLGLTAAIGLLAGCGNDGGEGGSAESAPVAASMASETSSSESEVELESVDPSVFEISSVFVFRYESDGTGGECTIRDTGATCIGTASDGVPDIEVPPFPAKPANAVTVGTDGVDYVLFEGVPPAPATLEAGHQVVVGGTTCAAPDSSTLECMYGDAEFTISGPDRLIETNTEPNGLYFVDSGSGDQVRATSTRTSSLPAQSGEICGVVDSSEFPNLDGEDLQVIDGPVDCDNALDVVGEYLDTPLDGDHGNANVRSYGDWGCSMPTARRSQELGLSVICSTLDGRAVGIST